MNHDKAFNQAKKMADLLRTLLKHLATHKDDRAVELPLAQLRVCGALCGGPQPMSAIGREMGVSQSAITQIADRLERAKLVKRVPKDDDRRVRCLRLTEKGERMMRRHEEIRIGRMAEALRHLGPRQTTQITAAVQTLIQAAIAARENNTKKPSLQGIIQEVLS